MMAVEIINERVYQAMLMIAQTAWNNSDNNPPFSADLIEIVNEVIKNYSLEYSLEPNPA